MRLCCEESITRGAVETSYLYICMGHTTYMHLNRQCRIVRWMGAIGQGRYLSMCALEHPKRTLSADPDPQRPTRQNGSSCASSLLYCLLRALPGPTGHVREHVAFSQLGSLRRPPGRGLQWIEPAVGISKHGVSAGMHGDEGVEEERAPGRSREALQAWIAASEGDGARVRDAAAHLESRREQVDHRDPQRGIQPRCMTEVRGKSADPG